jgi:hypothetical protein
MSADIPSDVRARILEFHWMSPSLISEAVGVPLAQVEAIVSEHIAESRRRLLAARAEPWKPSPTPPATKPVAPPEPKPPTAREQALERSRLVRQAREAKRVTVEEERAARRRELEQQIQDRYPTLDEIRATCELIQSEWTPNERRLRYRRANGSSGRWRPPVVHVSDDAA